MVQTVAKANALVFALLAFLHLLRLPPDLENPSWNLHIHLEFANDDILGKSI